jgi:hypothetical protein
VELVLRQMIEYGGPLRFHVPQVPPVSYQNRSLTLPVTTNSPEEARFARCVSAMAGIVCVLPSILMGTY